MKFFWIILFYLPAMAQNLPETEIYLFELVSSSDSLSFKNGKNISKNKGYDNQPSFYSNDSLIYARTRNGQTDIAGYHPEISENFWISHTKIGSEYSPKKIPNSTSVAAVRLDTTGLQRLYKYEIKSGESRELIPELKVGYFTFLDSHSLIASVLTGSHMDLVLYDLEKNTSQTIATNAGRSLHKVPGTASMSYTVVNEEGNLDLYLLDFREGEPSSFFICTLPAGAQDYVWLDRDRILLGSGNQLFLYNILGRTEWTAVADLSEYGLENITRMALNEKGTLLAIVAEPVVAAD